MEILKKIQRELKAPKNQKNTFGGYMYRSCEDILEAVKPLLGNALLVINDEMIMMGDRYYIKATATITEGDKSISATAYAREPITKKGMDEAQITGATSSYARKYALNGLFLIDDTKDADTMDNSKNVKTENKVISIDTIIKAMKKCTKVEELKDNENKFKASNKYTETQKKVILRAISEKILELEKNV